MQASFDFSEQAELFDIALDPTGEVVAFDEFIETYQKHYAPIGELQIYTVPNTGLDYKELMKMGKTQIEAIVEGAAT